jgi:tetratricopeptide (TPR) repeat protein
VRGLERSGSSPARSAGEAGRGSPSRSDRSRLRSLECHRPLPTSPASGGGGGRILSPAFWLVALLGLLLSPFAHAAPSATDEAKRIEDLYDSWRFEEANTALEALARTAPATAEVLYLQGYERFLDGDYLAAVAKLKAAAQAAPRATAIKEVIGLAEAAAEAIKGHEEKRSKHFVLRYPPEDAVIADYALEALESAITNLSSDLGFEPRRMIHVDIYRAPTDLASVSTLTAAEVERTGTIALCKWARLMATTPRALRFGYPWLDSLSHELVHYVVSTLSHDRAPVWLQEGLAKFLERRWREPAGPDLPPSMQHLLAKGLSSGKLISFEAMHPSMAKLPHAEDAALAFAEVATAIGSLHAKGGMEALRSAIARVREGVDARTAVAQAGGGTWPQFEKGWKAYMAAQHYRTFPGLEPVTRKFRKPGALASKRGPSEDEAVSGADPAARYLRLGNMLLLRNRARAATVEYERGAKAAGPGQWLFPVKLGRTYLALNDPERALKAVSEVRQLYPELPWPHLIAGQALLARGEPKKALASLEASLAANPFDPALHCAMADAYQRLPPGPDAPPSKRERSEKNCRELMR